MWFEVMFARTKRVNEVKGSVSGVLRVIVEMFFGSTGYHFRTNGVFLPLEGGMFVHVFLELDIIIADEAALHGFYVCKGSSGLKCCMLCQNVFNSKDTRGIVDGAGWAVSHDCHQTEKLVLHTRGTIDCICRRLAAARVEMSKSNFKELQIRLGWNLVPGSVMETSELRGIVDPTLHAVFDWMHVFFVQGVFNVHMGLLLQSLAAFNITCKMLDDYLHQWHWPVHLETKVGQSNGPLSAKRLQTFKKTGVFAATASEGLCVMQVTAHFLDRVAATSTSEELKHHITCFHMLVAVVSTIRRAAREVVNPDALKAISERYLETFKGLYGSEHMIPKFHSVLHFSMFLRRFPYVPNCFVLERKHKQPKRFANEARNTAGAWESSVARDVTSRHVSALEGRTAHDGLQDPVTPPSPSLLAMLQVALGVGDYMTSKSARINQWERVAKGDVVLLEVNGERVVGRIALLVDVAEADGSRTAFCQLECIEFVVGAGNFGAKFRRSPRLSIQLLRDIRYAMVWSGTGNSLTALYPSHLES